MPLTPISQPPRFVSAEQHAELTSATPADFADIPPVLRWQGEAEVQPPSEDSDETDATANGHADKLKGTLWVTEEALSFLPSSGAGFTIPYPQLTLHALTPATEIPAHIYCQLETEETEGEEYTPLSEMRIFVVPDQLDAVFNALSSCSALHASLLPSGEPSSFFGGGEWYGADGEFENADEEDDEDEGSGGRSDDEISRFLAKVDWSGVSTPTAANIAEDAEFEARMARFKVRSETPKAAAPPPMRDLNALAKKDEGEQVDLAAAFARFRHEYDAGWGEVESPLASNEGLRAELEAAQERIRALEAKLEAMKVEGGSEAMEEDVQK